LIRRSFALALAALLLAGCGGGGEHGVARLWVTRDRGAHVLLATTVPAGLTAMQALDRKTHVDTRYGGRFVQSIDGLAGSSSARRDWFYFVNGLEGDRSAAEYRLHPGDVEWWDYRSWSTQMEEPAVVGAFPEPFLHGFGGKRRRAVVVGRTAAARALAQVVHGTVVAGPPGPEANALIVGGEATRFHAVRAPGSDVVRFYISPRDAERLAARPPLARFRYEGLP
jgi:hypothetical protein